MTPLNDARPYLRHIADLNRHDPACYVPWYIGQTAVGLIRREFVNALSEHAEVFRTSDDRIDLIAGNDPAERSAVLDKVVRTLAARGVFDIRDEPHRVVGSWGEPSLAALDRAACQFFGIRAFGVHVNGFVRRHGEYYMWIGRRARDRAVSPGKLDHLVAGGMPDGLTARQTVAKEGQEEAGIPAGLIGNAMPCGFVSYAQDTQSGIKRDTLFAYDLEVGQDFLPCNEDGEVETFELLPLHKVASIVATSEDFKPNCNLIVIDFLVRHGVIGPDAEGYDALVRGLRGLK